MHELIRTALISMEIANMIGKNHSKLLRDIRNYVSQLGEAQICFTNFFTESTYVKNIVFGLTLCSYSVIMSV